MKKLLFLILALMVISACDDRPDHILSTGKMEDVLYDYHLAQSLIEELQADERDKMSQAYIDAVFEKHHITEAEFDSSMLYYNRDATSLDKIYRNLKTRFEEENQALALSTGNDVMTALLQNGDTANIWNASSLIVLRAKEGLNSETFTITADSSFHQQDRFSLLCFPFILAENSGSNNNYIQIGLTITYKDGKTTATTMRAGTSRNIQLYASALPDKDIASVSGFFYYNGTTTERNIAVMSSIGLIRMHTVHEEVKPVVKDSITVDTLQPAPIEVPHERLTPEQMRQKNQTDTRIKIKAAPEVRTPNSIGPRRKNARAPQSSRR